MATKRPLLGFFGYYKRHPWLLLWVFLVAVAANVTFPLHQHFWGQALEDIGAGVAIRQSADGSWDASGAWFWVWLMLGVALARGLMGYLGSVLGFVLGQKLLHHLRMRLFNQVQDLDIAYHQRHGAGEIISRTTRDGDKVRDAVVIASRMLMEMALFLIGVIAFMFFYHWSLGLITTISLLISVYWMSVQADRLVRLDRDAGDQYDALTQELTEGIAGIRVIKSFRLEQERQQRFDERLGSFMDSSRTAQRATAIRLTGPQLLVALAHGLVMWQAGVLVSQGAMGPGDLVAAVMMLLSAVFRMEAVARGVGMMAEARASAERLSHLLDEVPSLSSGAVPVPDGPVGVQLDRVSLQVEGKPVLQDCSLRVEPGEVVALVGATGSGKSTLMSLLPRQRDPDTGSVALLLADRSTHLVPDYIRNELRAAVQVCHQQTFLFSDTIAGNLRMAAPDASDEDLWAALHAVAADDMVRDMDDGLQSMVGEKGVTLSGGQKQRLCLARTLLAQPQLLVLDDATSALDARTEAMVFSRLRAASNGATILLGANRLSTVQRADRVLLLSDGRIVANGTHDELLTTQLRYRQLMGLELGESA